MNEKSAPSTTGKALGRNVLLTGLKCAIGGAVLVYLYHRGSLQLEHCRLSPGGFPLLGFGLLLLLAGMLAAPLRHYLLLRALDVRITFPSVLRIGLVGNFFNNFLLGSVGGDIVRFAYVAQGGNSRSAAAASALVDRMIGLASIFFLAAFALAVNYRSLLDSRSLHGLAIAIVGISFGGAACTFLGLQATSGRFPGKAVAAAHLRKIPGGPKLLALVRALALYRKRPRELLAAFAISVAIQGLTVLSIFVFGNVSSLERPPSLSQVFLATPIAFLANTLPLPGGGLGAGEAAFEQALACCPTAMGNSALGGASLFLFWRCCTVLLGLIGLPIYLLSGFRLAQEKPHAVGEHRPHQAKVKQRKPRRYGSPCSRDDPGTARPPEAASVNFQPSHETVQP